MKKRFTEEQIVGFLREAERGVAVKNLCRRRGFSEASYYLWRSKYGGMEVSDVKRLKALESENARLKKLLAESMLENEVIGRASGDHDRDHTVVDRLPGYRGKAPRLRVLEWRARSTAEGRISDVTDELCESREAGWSIA